MDNERVLRGFHDYAWHTRACKVAMYPMGSDTETCDCGYEEWKQAIEEKFK